MRNIDSIRTTSQRTRRLLLAAAAAAVLAGCASTAGTSDQAETTGFPDPDSAWLKRGTFVNVEQLRRIGRGMNKNQVRELIGAPHFQEGLFGVAEWNYLFNFRTGRGEEYVTCQYRVTFKDGTSDAMRWKDATCADRLQPPVIATASPSTSAAPERIRLGADALFAFDRSGPADILPEGRRQLETLASDLKTKYRTLEGVTVTGHTDRLGTSGYNQALSLARAETVRTLLAQAGVDARAIRATGKGESEAVVDCPGTVTTPALVRCLQPNRRVDIEVTGQQ